MNRRWLSFVWVAPLFGAWAVGCSDDDGASVVTTPDAGSPDAGDGKDAATPAEGPLSARAGDGRR